MTHRVSASEQGQLQGANSSVQGIAGLVGPGLFTWIFAYFISTGRSWQLPGAPFLLGSLRGLRRARVARHSRAMNVRLACAALLAAYPALAQKPIDQQVTGRAVRVATPPVIDGRDDDAAWQSAPPMTGFRQFDPGEDLDPTFRTEARVVYDDQFLYVLVRAYDPHPDSIVSLLSRRDVKTASDQIKIMIDAFHDQRTGVEFVINPSGVKLDYAIYSDNTEDITWDGVWDAAAQIDSKGWVAEFRIPLSQLRFHRSEEH